MNKLVKLIKQSHYAIFTIFILALAVAVVIGFNAIIAENIQINPAQSGAPVGGNTENQLKSFDSQTATHLRGLTSASNVTSAPDISDQGRLNPFAE